MIKALNKFITVLLLAPLAVALYVVWIGAFPVFWVYRKWLRWRLG
jgi:hypothetical protein